MRVAPGMTNSAETAQTTGDPALMNAVAWSIRWQDRCRSTEYAEAARAMSAGNTSLRVRANLGRAVLTLAWQAKWRGAFDDALSLALETERHISEADYPDERAHNYSILGVVHYSRGRLDLASSSTDRGLLLADVTRDAPAFIDLLSTRASILRHRGDSGRAGLVLSRAEEVAEGPDEARIQHNIARWLLEDGEVDKATERAERSIDLADRHKCRVIAPYANEVHGAALSRRREFDAAEQAFATGLAIAEEDRDVRAQCQILRVFGAMEDARGNSDAALALSERGARIAARMGYLLWQQRFARDCALLHERRGDLKAALEAHKLAWTLSDKRRN